MYWGKYGIESKKKNEKGLGKDERLKDSREGWGEGRRKEWSKGRR